MCHMILTIKLKDCVCESVNFKTFCIFLCTAFRCSLFQCYVFFQKLKAIYMAFPIFPITITMFISTGLRMTGSKSLSELLWLRLHYTDFPMHCTRVPCIHCCDIQTIFPCFFPGKQGFSMQTLYKQSWGVS